jgi:hypothetical protein
MPPQCRTSPTPLHPSSQRWLGWDIDSALYWLRNDVLLIREVDRLISLALEYAARFVSGAARAVAGDAAIKLGVVLLGSGWRWYATCRAKEEFDRRQFLRDYEKRFRARIEVLSQGHVQLDGINTRLFDERLEKLAVSIGVLQLGDDPRDDFDEILAPNGLSDDHCSWDTLVGPEGAAPIEAPGRVDPEPAFDDDLEE